MLKSIKQSGDLYVSRDFKGGKEGKNLKESMDFKESKERIE